MPMMWEKHPMFMTWLYTTDTILITTSCTEAQSRIEATSKINVKGFVDIVINLPGNFPRHVLFEHSL